MDFQATFSNQSGQAKTLDIKDGFNLQDAYNVVANDDFAPTQITLEPINMNSSYSNVEPDKQVETAYDLIGRHSSNDIIDKHKISSDELAALLEEGTNHELEHTSSYLIAMKIAQDHLYEDLMYYSKIKQAMLSRGAALNMSKGTPKYAEGTKLSYPIYVRLKANVDKFAVMNFLNQYPKVEDVMNRYVRTPNVKAGYLTFMADKDANDQNLEQWGAKVKGYYESPDGTKIKRYEWNFGEAEGFAEVFQYLYDKYNGYAKGGVMGKDYSEKMMSSAYAMPFQDWFNKNIMDVTESYNDAKRDYEDGQNKPFGIKLGKYAKSLHNEFAKNKPQYEYNNGVKDGGRYAKGGKMDDGSENFGKPPIEYSEIPFIHETKKSAVQEILKSGFVIGTNPVITKGVYTIPIVWKNEKFDRTDNTQELVIWLKEGAKIFWTNTERPTDYYLGYGNKFYENLYSKLNEGHKSPKDDFNNKQYQEAFCRRMEKWLKDNGYGGVQQGGEVVITDLESIDYIDYFERKGSNPDIRFDKGGYVSEEVLIENNIGKIDDIYVLSENDKPVKSLGEFTLRGFGKFVMKDLAGELYDDYKIRLRSDFAIMLGNDIIKPSIKVAQMKGNEIELLAIIYNALVTDEQPVSYVFNEDGEVVGKFTDEDFAEDMVNDNDGYYSEVRVEEVSTPETILAMQFDFNKQEMTFVSTLLEKQSTHKFKYGGKL